MFLSTRTDPLQEVKLEPSRKPGGKITQIEICFPLPKPDVQGNETASFQLAVKMNLTV